ncbi:hypothetical protein GCM10022403_044170 [Streptomyces coacervatus]|uniref:Uncharacterized protein n=1 Tax=Streptomyces coacervatus TaxID=647381 RepID=A0ABP7HVF0_9ACTN
MALRDEPNRLRPIGHVADHALGRTESKLFPNGTKRGGKKNPAPVRTGEDAPERGARGDGGGPHVPSMLEDTAVRALWFSYQPSIT